jgi:hypothetical protein
VPDAHTNALLCCLQVSRLAVVLQSLARSWKHLLLTPAGLAAVLLALTAFVRLSLAVHRMMQPAP